MAMPEIEKGEFFAWADRVLSGALPESVVAFHFNLYEGIDSVHVQIVGTESFNPEGGHWPGKETFSSGEDVFHVPFGSLGSNWQEWLEAMKILVGDYLSGGRQSDVLHRSQGVGIGFVDGDMYVLWRPA